ncbi:ShlB/FhaC/HecB family hemolysin secretion/activation protein [Pseudorhodoferax soli]|uniref:Hemolysin activation/secretion protein n=1 Tax=Pseudorhodoferax soli TaxID=545864 RepID=A0A368Y8S1_9BURK|nr:ShlB/FhaC/HecB family hemolysin secretion/activation protein [Pseudorhodoferax soli]RCW76671.1 hemolysin activation/secretion protein [Pseudorhodoferax soli]
MPSTISASRRSGRCTALVCWLLTASSASLAQVPPPADAAVEELRRQERQRLLREQFERGADVRVPVPEVPATSRLPSDEQPCFRIDALALQGAEPFPWLAAAAAGPDGDDSPVGRCLGTRGINAVLARLQQALVARGWITSLVLAAPQDLATGELRLNVVPGRIAAIRSAAGATSLGLRSAVPAAPGDLLNLRDIEQGLENYKRLPTVEADIRIEPAQGEGAEPGDSDLVIDVRRAPRALGPLRLSMGLDDSGTRATGRLQANATLAWDGPLGLNDLAYLNLQHGMFNPQGRGTGGATVHYSVPFGDWLLGATASRSRYHQRVAGLQQDYVYAGASRNFQVQVTRLLHRGQRHKTSLTLGAFRRSNSSFIDDTEIEVQRRVVGGWSLELAHRAFIALEDGNTATLDASLGWRRGTGAFGAQPAPEQAFGEGTARFALATAEASLQWPLQWGTQRLAYTGQARAQWNRTPLAAPERFGIGSRYTVRGFDGESSLLADRGWLLRNELAWTLGTSGTALYAGLDFGRVGGPSARQLPGRSLAGAVLGLRGQHGAFSWDVFAGTPLRKPQAMHSSSPSLGFSLQLSF